jgi:hypothetical protein
MIKVFDDLIPNHLQNYFELITLGKTSIPDEVMHPLIDFKVKYETTAEENNQSPLSLVHVLKSSTVISPHLENFSLIPAIVCDKIKFTLIDIVLARLYLILPHSSNLEHYAPHVDFPFPHTVVLYYLNDADGDTVFFDKQGNIIERVSPKKGRVLVFDGRLYHGGGIPKKGPRSVVNFDILTKEIE